MTRALKRGLATPASSVVVVLVLFVLAPAAAIAGLGAVVHPALRGAHWAIASAFLFTSVAMAFETWASSRRAHASARPTTPPSLSVVVAAYLPNEQEIIVETLRHVLRTLRVHTNTLQIVLAYNTPSELDIEEILHRIGDTAA